MPDLIKILLVEDSEDDEKLLVHVLKRAGLNFNLFRVDTEEDFIKQLREFHPDLIITDYSLPQIEAPRVLELAKEHNYKIPVILVTGSQTEEVAIQSIKSGAEDYLLKHNLLRLPSAIQHILEKRKIEKEKERAQTALRKTEELYEMIAEHTQDLICVLDKDGYFIYLNSSFEKVLHYDKNSLIGTNYFQIIHPNDRDYIIKLFEESYLKRTTQTTEVRYKDSLGEWHTFESVGNWIIDSEGNPDKIVIISRDLTERQKWEETIVQAKEKAEESAEFKSWFISAISHEIRTPLNVMLGYSNIIKENLLNIAPDLYNSQYFRNIEKAGKRLLNTITQILDISKIEAGQFPLELEPVSLNYTVRTVYEMVKVIAVEKGLKLTYDIPTENIVLRADEYCLNGLITNLVSNAIKYSDSGEIKISIRKLEDFGELVVEDQGIGMSQEYLNHLYEIFTQEESLKRRYEGAGLGLALSKKYVEMMNGKIEVESLKNIGTKITVLIPLEKTLVDVKPNHSQSNENDY